MGYIFLSYASEDGPFAEKVQSVATALGFDMWMDRARLKPGYRWEPAIEAAIADASGAVFLVTPNSVDKDGFIQNELDMLLVEAAKRDRHEAFLLPVRIGGSHLVHPKLSAYQHFDLAADDPTAIPRIVTAITASFHTLIESAERHKDRRAAQARKDASHPADEAIRAAATPPRAPKPPATDFLFEPDEFDIYVNKQSYEAFFFHGKPVDQDILYFEYDPSDHGVLVYKAHDRVLDLGVKIQWLVRPHLLRAYEIGVVQTKDGESVDGFYAPLRFKDDDPELIAAREAAGLRRNARMGGVASARRSIGEAAAMAHAPQDAPPKKRGLFSLFKRR